MKFISEVIGTDWVPKNRIFLNFEKKTKRYKIVIFLKILSEDSKNCCSDNVH